MKSLTISILLGSSFTHPPDTEHVSDPLLHRRYGMRTLVWSKELDSRVFVNGIRTVKYTTAGRFFEHQIQSVVALFINRISMFRYTCPLFVPQQIAVEREDERIGQKQHFLVARALATGFPS